MSKRKALYHGSPNPDIKPGDTIRPARETGISHTESGTSYAWATPDPTFAAHYTDGSGAIYRVSSTEPRYPWDMGKQQIAGSSWRVEARAWTPENQDTDRIERAKNMAQRQEALARSIKGRMASRRSLPADPSRDQQVEEIMGLLNHPSW